MSAHHPLRKRKQKTLAEAAAEWLQSIEDAQKEKPLPEKLQAMPAAKVTPIVLDMRKFDGSHRTIDTLASRGMALKISQDATSVGFKVLEKKGGKTLSTLQIPVADITEDAYLLFTLPETTLTPDSLLIVPQQRCLRPVKG